MFLHVSLHLLPICTQIHPFFSLLAGGFTTVSSALAMGKVVDVFKLVNPKDKKVCEHVGNVTFPGLVRTQILQFYHEIFLSKETKPLTAPRFRTRIFIKISVASEAACLRQIKSLYQSVYSRSPAQALHGQFSRIYHALRVLVRLPHVHPPAQPIFCRRNCRGLYGGRRGLQLKSRFIFVQLRHGKEDQENSPRRSNRIRHPLDPAPVRHCALHFDFSTERKMSVYVTLSSVFSKLGVTHGTVINHPLKLSDKWTVIAMDVGKILDLYAEDTPRFLRRITMSGNLDVRGVFCSNKPIPNAGTHTTCTLGPRVIIHTSARAVRASQLNLFFVCCSARTSCTFLYPLTYSAKNTTNTNPTPYARGHAGVHESASQERPIFAQAVLVGLCAAPRG